MKFNEYHEWVERYLQKTIKNIREGVNASRIDGKSVTTMGQRRNSAPSVKTQKSILIEANDNFWLKGLLPNIGMGLFGGLNESMQQSSYMDQEVNSFRCMAQGF